MTTSPVLDKEAQRLAALERLNLLDNTSDPDFDDIVYLAAQICETPISYISFIDANKQWFKAKVGIKATESPREISLCSLTILGDDILIVPDTTKDERFANNPVVKNPPHFRFYAGIPVKDTDGFALGTICVVDYKIRELSDHQKNALKILGRQVSNLLEIRSKEIRLTEKKKLLETNELQLKDTAFQLNAYFNSTTDAILLLNLHFEIVAYNKFASSIIQTLYKKDINEVKNILDLIEKGRQNNFLKNLKLALSGEEVKVEVHLPQFENNAWWYICFLPIKNDANEVTGIAYTCTNIDAKKKAEEALNSSEKRLSLILANSNDGWWDRDLEKNIWYFSDSWCKLLGCKNEDKPKSLEELRNFVHPEDFEKTSNFLIDNNSPEDQLFEVEIRLKHKKGHFIPILSRGHILKNSEGKAVRISGTNIDLTERKKTEEQLRINERHLSLIFNTIKDVIFVVDVEPDQKFRFTSINKAFLETTGLTSDQIVGKLIEDVIAKESLALVKSKYVEAVESHKSIQWEETSKYPNGTKTGIVSISPVMGKNGTCVQIIGSIHEITERKKIERELAENQRFLQTLITNLPGYSYRVKNDKNYTAEYLSEGVTKITGHEVSEYLIEKTITCGDEIIEEDREWVWNKIQDSLKEKRPFELTYRIKTKHGNIKWVWEHGQGVWNSAGELEALEGFVEDITNRKNAEDTVRQNEKILRNIFNVSPVALLISRVSDGLVVMANESLEKLVGASNNEVIGKHTVNYYANLEDRKNLKEIIYSKGSAKNLEIPIKRFDGSTVSCLASAELITLNGEEMFLTGFIDISERMKAEEKLRLSEHMFSEMAKNVPGVIYQFHVRPDGTTYFSYMSSRIKEIFGQEVVENDPNWDLSVHIPEEDKEYFFDSIRTAIFEFKEWTYEGKIHIGNGDYKWFEGKALPTRIGEDIVYNGIIIDITQRKSVENELKESEQILQNIFNFSPVPLMISRVSDGKIIMANEGVEKLMGVSVDKILGNKTLNQYVDIEDRIKIMTAITQTGGIKNLEVPFKRFDGKVISCLISTEMVVLKGKKMFLTAITDISERKRAEEALQKSEDNLRTVFENTQVGYILFNDNLIVKSFNQPAQEFTNKELNKSLVEGSFFLDYMQSDDYEELQENLRLVLAGNLVEYDLKLGQENWYHIKFSPVSNKETYVVGFIMAIENITDRKKSELELNKSFDLVNQQNKRLLNFSYIVSHNLRSRTSNIISMLSLIQTADSEEEKSEMIEMLVDVSKELNETILNLNDVVSIQSNVNIVVDQLNLRSYINKAIHVVGDQIAAKKATVKNNVAADVLINYNPAYLESVLFNFISNGIKYGHPDRLPVITLDCYYEKERLVLRIADNGIGIDMKKNGEKLFGMFKTFHGNSDARGVGLFITKNQIEAMGGKVEVESKLQQGTTFKIYF